MPNPQLNESTAPYQFDGAVTATGTVSATGPVTLSGAATLSGTVTVSGPATVSGTTTMSGPVTMTGAATLGGVSAPQALSPLAPADVALKAWTFPTFQATGTSTFCITGSVYLALAHLAQGLTYSTIYADLAANAGTASAGSCFAGVYNAAGTLVATTADLSGVLGTALGTTGYLAFPLATAYSPPSSAPHYVGMFFNASGTASMPVFRTAAGITAANAITTSAAFAAGPLGTTPYPYAAVATTSGTAMPPTFALGSAGTTNAIAYWAGVA